MFTCTTSYFFILGIMHLWLGNESEQANTEGKYVIQSHPLESHEVTINVNWQNI